MCAGRTLFMKTFVVVMCYKDIWIRICEIINDDFEYETTLLLIAGIAFGILCFL